MFNALASEITGPAISDEEARGYVSSDVLQRLLQSGSAPRHRRPAWSKIWWDGDETEEEKRIARLQNKYAAELATVINREYPGCLFIVEPNFKGGIVRIRHPLLPAKWGYTLFLRQLYSDPSLKCVVDACGELLERFNLPRGRYRRDVWSEARQKHWRTAAGIMPRKVDPKTGKSTAYLPPELAR